MADISNHKKRKKSASMNILVEGGKVEVRSVEDGFQGSWHPGVIVSCETRCRKVKYANLLADNGKELVEKVHILTKGNTTASDIRDRGRIRPSPFPFTLTERDLHYGLCVDCYYNEAWWEGVVFDHDHGSSERIIFFPDLGDELKSNVMNLRLTNDWDEITGDWVRRGNWYFLQIMEEYERDNKFFPVSIKQIWYDMKAKKEFGKIGEWPFPIPSLWQKLVEQVMEDNMRLTFNALLKDEDFLREKEEALTIVDETCKSAELAIVDYPDSGRGNNEVVNVQPEALSIMCSDQKGTIGSKPKRQSKRDCRADHNNELRLESKLCQNSLYEYLQEKRPANNLTKNVRRHLLALGYKMERRENLNCICYMSPRGRTYYNLRECVKFEKKLVENSSLAAEDIRSGISSSLDNPNCDPQPLKVEKSSAKYTTRKRKQEENPSEEEEDDDRDYSLELANTSGVFGKHKKRKPLNLNVQSKYCPEIVPRYLKLCEETMPRFLGEVQDELRGHLSAIGWKFRSKKRYEKEEWRYDSPTTKKMYCSLRSVCRAILEGKETQFENSKEFSNGSPSLSREDVRGFSLSKKWSKKYSRVLRKLKAGKSKRKKTNGYAHSIPSLLNGEEQEQENGVDGFSKRNSIERLSTSFISKKKRALGKVKNSSRVLRSRKRAQVGPSSSSPIPRTVLSWLIDNNVVLAKEKVQYFREGDDKPIGEGQISNIGIKCSCCSEIYTLSGFEAHIGSNSHRPTANLFFCRDGKSLVQRQLDLIDRKIRSLTREPVERACGKRNKSWNDHICSVCRYGGELILCDRCPSSFHARCLDLEDIPEGDWFCPSCCCEICKESDFDNADKNVLSCHQCERKYHAHCVRNNNMVGLDAHSTDNWFCCKTCEKVHWGLQQLLGKPILVGHNNLTWTLVKSMDYMGSDRDDCDVVSMAENFSKLSVALEVMHECFEPVIEPRTRRDLIEDAIFSRGSHLNRLNFKGFYTILLERNDELITAAILRVYGEKVAEIPLIGTQLKHRRLGMCRVVMEEIEKNLIQLGVKRLVLPAAPSVLNTWTTAFGFTPVNQSERSEFLSYSFLDFQDTVMCQKLLRLRPSLPLLSRGIGHRVHRNLKGNSIILEPEGNSAVSEVSQEDILEGSETVDQGALVKGTEEKSNSDGNGQDAPIAMLTYLSNTEYEPCSNLELKEQKIERENSDENSRFYKRKKTEELRPRVSQANCPKVEVSCR